MIMRKAHPKKYEELHWGDKGLDIILLIAVVVSILFFVLELLYSHPQIIRWGHILNVGVLGIFFVDMTRHFLKSQNIIHFFKHHWPDMLIVTIPIISLSSVLFLGLGRLSWLIREEAILAEEEGIIIKVLRLGRRIKF